MSPADYFDFVDQAAGGSALTTLGAFTAGDTVTLRLGEPARVIASTVSTNFFDILGAGPAIGRTLVAADAAPGSAAVAIVSDTFWRTRMNGQAPGAQISLDTRPVTVVGVMPAGFAFPGAAADLWMPIPVAERSRSRSAHYLDVIGRLQPGATVDGAADALRTVAARLASSYPDTNRGWSVTVEPLHDSIVGGVRRPLLILLAAVGGVLLIACANVAGILLADGHGRTREMALRTVVRLILCAETEVAARTAATGQP